MKRNLVKSLASAAFLVAAGFSGLGCGEGLEEGAPVEEGVQTVEQGLLSNGEVRSGVAPDLCLDVTGGVPGSGVNVQNATCNGSLAQKWTQTAAGELRSGLAPNLCLDVAGGGTLPGTNVQIHTCNGTAAQKWTWTATGEFRSAVTSNLCLDVANASPTPGANVQVWSCNSTKAQQWFQIPRLPVTVTQALPITIHSARFTNGTNSMLKVPRGQLLTVTVDYTLSQSSACSGCIDQILIGFSTESVAQACVYDGVPAATGTSGSSTVTVTAPSSPGVYYLRFRYGQALSCNLSWWTVNGAPGEQQNMAVITVE